MIKELLYVDGTMEMFKSVVAVSVLLESFGCAVVGGCDHFVALLSMLRDRVLLDQVPTSGADVLARARTHFLKVVVEVVPALDEFWHHCVMRRGL